MTTRTWRITGWGWLLFAVGCALPAPTDRDQAPVTMAPWEPPTGIDDPIPPPVGEPCDGLDNDVDGAVDEDCYCELAEVQSCYPAELDLAGIGICRLGVQHCVNVRGDFGLGDWSSCEGAVLPRDEICGNGIDEDCDGSDAPCHDPGPVGEACADGEVEACYPGPPETEGVGACHAGVRQCLGGRWGGCEGAVEPSDEICENDIDEDCDGEICL